MLNLGFSSMVPSLFNSSTIVQLFLNLIKQGNPEGQIVLASTLTPPHHTDASQTLEAKRHTPFGRCISLVANLVFVCPHSAMLCVLCCFDLQSQVLFVHSWAWYVSANMGPGFLIIACSV